MVANDSSSASLDDLADHAGHIRVAVVGGGIAGLVAARECARLGLRVSLYEASDRLGGAVRTRQVAGLPVDTGADILIDSPGALADLVAQLGLTDRCASPSDQSRAVVGLAGQPDVVPLPADTIWGIPENMWSEQCRAILGSSGTWRAYLDRLRPPLTIGHERRLAALVRTRMGQKVLDRLVRPLVWSIHGVEPEQIDVDMAAPGLNAALTRTGSLSGAVALQRAELDTSGRGARGIVGGLTVLVDALQDELVGLGVQIRLDAAVTGLEQAGAAPGSGWVLHVDADEYDMTDDDTPEEIIDAVIVAAEEPVARRLLAPVVPDLDDQPAAVSTATAAGTVATAMGTVSAAMSTVSAAMSTVETVTLVVDAPALDAAPAGGEVVTVPGSRAAVSALHATARWGWLAEAARRQAPGRHVVRVTFGGAETPVTATLDDAEATRLALAEASALLGVPLTDEMLRGACRERFRMAPPRALMGRVASAERERTAIERIPGLTAVGAWLSGSGLAQVVPDASATADRFRRRTLFAQSGTS